MLGKEHHRLEFAIIVEEFNVSCADLSKVNDINNLCLQLSYYGATRKDRHVKTECISSRRCVNPAKLYYSLSWREQPVLNFHVVLTKRKGCYERLKKPPELFLSLSDGYEGIKDEKVGSTKLESLHEHANNKETGQSYDEEVKIIINLRNKKRLSWCELVVRYRIPDLEPGVVEDFASSRVSVSPAMTPSVSIDTINSLDARTLTHRTLKQPILKLLNEVYLIGVDNNRYLANWTQMHLIFFVFGTMPDVIEKFSDFVNTLGAAPGVGEHVAVVHICQGHLAASDVLYPYLPLGDDQNPAFHDLFHIPLPHPDHPKICVVNRKLTEYYVVESYEIERYLEEKSPVELYYLWNHWPVPPSLHPESGSSPHTDLSSIHKLHLTSLDKSGSLPRMHQGELNSSFEGSSLPYSSRSSVKAMKPTETSEYKALQTQLASTTAQLQEAREQCVELQEHVGEEKRHNEALTAQLEKFKILEVESHKMIEKCQKENIFFRHQVLLRGNLALRSGTFNLFKTRWFQLESGSSQEISPVISFYDGQERLGQIVLEELISYETLSGTRFKVVTKFVEYMLNADTPEESTKWVTGINTLYRGFCAKQVPDTASTRQVSDNGLHNGLRT